jgi:sterol O-acyltransferase
MQNTKWVRGRQTLNNVFFWASMILGLSLVRAVRLSFKSPC